MSSLTLTEPKRDPTARFYTGRGYRKSPKELYRLAFRHFSTRAHDSFSIPEKKGSLGPKETTSYAPVSFMRSAQVCDTLGPPTTIRVRANWSRAKWSSQSPPLQPQGRDRRRSRRTRIAQAHRKADRRQSSTSPDKHRAQADPGPAYSFREIGRPRHADRGHGAHEINNPLAFAVNNLAVLERDFGQLLNVLSLHEQLGHDHAAARPDLAAALARARDEADLAYSEEELADEFSTPRTRASLASHRSSTSSVDLPEFDRAEIGRVRRQRIDRPMPHHA